MRLFVDNLTNVDFSYLCPERGLLGETWMASIALEGALDEQGMVCDFGKVKKFLRHWLDDTLDHKLLLPIAADQLQWHTSDQNNTAFEWWFSDNERLTSQAPAQALCQVAVQRITPEHLAHWCKQQILDAFGAGVENVELYFSPEETTGPYYHYSHGLKKHLGNCQRIAHGHRSRIEIWRDDQLCTDTMETIAEQWRDIYLGTRSDVVQQNDTHTEFAYRAQQGDFKLQLPSHCVYLMDEDTTVENISAHLARTLKQQSPQDHIRVKAYEGYAKGAVSSS